jgi:hypothetical protein
MPALRFMETNDILLCPPNQTGELRFNLLPRRRHLSVTDPELIYLYVGGIELAGVTQQSRIAIGPNRLDNCGHGTLMSLGIGKSSPCDRFDTLLSFG